MKLVILPGWQHHSEHWTAVSELLHEKQVNHKIIDLPGFGKEPYLAELQNINDVANWLEQKLSIEEGEIILVGHSYGGRVAVAYASREPKKIKKMILIGSPNLYHVDLGTKIKKLISLLLSPIKFLVPETLRSKYRSEDYKNVYGTKLESLFKNIVGENQRSLLNKISIPTLLIWGENDASVPTSVAHEIKNLIHKCELEIIDGVGHNVHLEKPHLLVTKITKYAKNF